MRKLSSWFHTYGLLYANFYDLRDITQPSTGFWKAFRKMLRTMQFVDEKRCVVEFQGEYWRLELSNGTGYVADELVFGKLKELVKKRIRPYWIEIYERWAKVLFCIGPFSEGKTKYRVTIYRVRK